MSSCATPAVLFDLDGTLVDTDRLHIAAFNEVLARFGRQITWDKYRTTVMGFPNETIFSVLFPEVPASQHGAMAEEKEELFRAKAHALEPTQGFLRFLDLLEERSVAMAIVTNAPRKNAELMLKALGVATRFEHLIIGDELARGKPDPLPYLTAMQRLGAAPYSSIAFEDSRGGMRAAVSAGVLALGITTSLDADELMREGAVMGIPDFNDPRLLPLISPRLGWG